MTQDFSSPFQNVGAGFDYYTSGTQPAEVGVVPAQRNTLRVYTPPHWRSIDAGGGLTAADKYGAFEIIISDFSLQGYNHPEGDFSRNSNGFAWSCMGTSRPGELTPGIGSNSQARAVTGDLVGLHSAYAFSTLFMGLGAAANLSLFKETSSTNPVPVGITFSPGGSICSLTRTLDTGAERLAVGMVGAAVKLMSDNAGTVAATMHTSTNSCWGIIMSGINSTTPGTPVMLMYCGTTIGTKATDASMTTAITTTQTGVNAGGRAVGAVTAKGRAQRAYWLIPLVSNTSGALKLGAEALMEVWSTNMEAGDLLPSRFQYLPYGVLEAEPFRDGLLMHDGLHVVYWDGQTEFDLGLFRKRITTAGFDVTLNTIDSDQRRRVRQLLINGPECGVVWEWFDANAVDAGNAQVETYNFESGSWHGATVAATLLATTAVPEIVLAGNGGTPISPNTRRMYYYSNGLGQFIYNFLARPAESLLWQNSAGTAGTNETGLVTYAGAQLLGCRWWLDGIKRNPKVITEVEFDGNMDYGRSGSASWTFTVEVQGRGIDGTTTYIAYNQSFTQGGTSADYKRANPPESMANIQDVQMFLNLVVGNQTIAIPLLLPFTIRGIYSKLYEAITDVSGLV